MSAGTRSSAITATAPASSAILACSGVTTSMITPPLQHLGQARLDRERRLAAPGVAVVLHRSECSRGASFRATSVDAVFVQDGDTFTATDLAVGPWYPGTLHGGAPAALSGPCPPRSAWPAAGVAAGPDHIRVAPAGADGGLPLQTELVRPGRGCAPGRGPATPDQHRGEQARSRCGTRSGARRRPHGPRRSRGPELPSTIESRRTGDDQGNLMFPTRRDRDPVRGGAVPRAGAVDRLVSPPPPAGGRRGDPAAGATGRRRDFRTDRLGRQLRRTTCSSTRI